MNADFQNAYDQEQVSPVLSSVVRELDCFADISGRDDYGRPKARIQMRYYTYFSDGREEEHQVVMVEKPILSVFKHINYITHESFVNVRMDFDQAIDQDLREIWLMLDEHSSPVNSVDYTPEERESGFYTDAQGQHLVYYPTIELLISPVNQEGRYAMIGVDPAFYTLDPKEPGGQPCVLQLTFPESGFLIVEPVPLDPEKIQREALQELGMDPLQAL